ncbi:hypothetical protein, partial [Mycolicibacter minnesotensis]|uniref:hypothetical protein n=1 Tax=Mycolicibacter minnesotensis TaxID=1118379 RepID=UPI0021F302A1
MSTRVLSILRLSAAAAAFAVLAGVEWGAANAAPTADNQGYVNSTARCASPSETVVFGSTESSRVAICEVDGEYVYRGVRLRDGAKLVTRVAICEVDGEYVYRGVRLRDGAKLVIPATKSGDGYTAENNGITYTVTEDSLVVSTGSRVIREETMIDFHTAQMTEVG